MQPTLLATFDIDHHTFNSVEQAFEVLERTMSSAANCDAIVRDAMRTRRVILDFHDARGLSTGNDQELPWEVLRSCGHAVLAPLLSCEGPLARVQWCHPSTYPSHLDIEACLLLHALWWVANALDQVAEVAPS